MKTIMLLTGVWVCFFVSSCHKQMEVDTDPTQPTIILTDPTNNQVYVSMP